MKGVIYARFSCDNQREESIEGQVRECKVFAERSGIDIVGQYTDRAKSATTDKRPGFQQMIADSAKHEFEVIVVWKLDRFARNRYDSAHYKAQLRKNGVRVVSATEAISEGAEGVLLESVLEGMAEYYSKELSEKTLRGMTENALKCKSNGGRMPIGLKPNENGDIVIDEDYAPIVLEAFNLFADGMNMQEVATSMSARGARTPSGKPVTLAMVKNMLHNRKYIGEYRFKDVVIPGGIPAIVPQELFDRVQARLKLRRHLCGRGNAEEEYLLTTKLYCGNCKRMMAGESCHNRTSKKYRYYKCPGFKYHLGCTRKGVRKEPLEDAVVRMARDILFDGNKIDELIDAILKENESSNSIMPSLEKQLSETEKGINNILNAIQQGINSPTASQRLNDLEKEKRDIEMAIAKENLTQSTLTEEQLRMWFERLKELDISTVENKRKLIDTFINAVYVYDDKIVIAFNVKRNSETITFDEINNSGIQSYSGAKGSQRKRNVFGHSFFFVFSLKLTYLSDRQVLNRN